jgi:hypothetical protein
MKFFSGLLLSVMTLPAVAATARDSARVISSELHASRMLAGVGVDAGARYATSGTVQSAAVSVEPVESVASTVSANVPSNTIMAAKEKCLQNNAGLGDFFVWASRYSNTQSYSSMIEDVYEPENNTCFVKVSLDSDDPAINLSDMPHKYVIMGKNIVCGNWADEAVIEERILTAKKKGRVWASVGAAVGGAAVGVGAMELFGNKLIGGAVEGQAALKGSQLICSQLKTLKEQNQSGYNSIIDEIKILKDACSDDKWQKKPKPEECKKYDFDYLSGC